MARELAELALLAAVLAVVGSLVEMPIWIPIGLPLAKAMTSVVFYLLFLRRTLRRPPGVGPTRLLGKVATTATALRPLGQVKIAGELWSARSADGSPIARSERVEIVRVEGNTVHVAPPRSGGPEPADAWNPNRPL